MISLDLFGIGGIGFVFGYLLFYAVRHTDNFNVALLSSALGAVGSQTILELFFKEKSGVIGAYGIGLFFGFVAYFSLVFLLSVQFGKLKKPLLADETKLTVAGPSGQFDPDTLKLTIRGKGWIGKDLMN